MRTETVLASAARTTTQTSADYETYGAKGCRVFTDQTVNASSAGSTTTKIQGKDVVSGKYYDILSGAALAAVGTEMLTVYPAITVATNVSVSTVLPPVIRVVVTANNANPVTETVSLVLFD